MEDTLGQLNVSDADIALGIAIANTHFSKIGTAFNICSTYVHPNVRNDTIKAGVEDKEIAVMYDVPNTINIYYAIEVIGSPDPCGFGPQGKMTSPVKTSDRDAIFINKICAQEIALTHILGHYFGLFNTFEQVTNGTELVDGTNCATTGDLICDTPADNGAGTDAFCDLSVPTADINGDYYTPPTCNIMSMPTDDPCKDNQFTTGQYDRMLEIMEKGRNYLW
jgi:hypothetical protein